MSPANLLKHVTQLNGRLVRAKEELSFTNSERDNYGAQVLTLESQVTRLKSFSRQSQEEVQKQGTINAHLKESFASQCRRIVDICQQIVSDHSLNKGELLDDDLYNKLEFKAFAQKSNFFSERNILPSGGGMPRLSRKSRSSESVAGTGDKLLTPGEQAVEKAE